MGIKGPPGSARSRAVCCVRKYGYWLYRFQMSCEFIGNRRNFSQPLEHSSRLHAERFQLTLPRIGVIAREVVSGVVTCDNHERHEHDFVRSVCLQLWNDAFQRRVTFNRADMDIGIALGAEFAL